MIWGSELRHTIYVVLISLLLLAGCSSKQRLEAVPTPLTAIDAAFTAEKDWSYHLDPGNDLAYSRARQAVITTTAVYFCDDKGMVYALTATEGDRQWQNDTDLSLSSGVAYAPDQGLVLVGSYDGDVLAIGAEDGLTRWQSRVSSEVLVAPAVSDGVIIVRSIDGKLAALDVTDGRQLWTYQAQVPVLSLHGNSSPLIYQGQVVVGLDDGRLLALDLRDGHVLWEETVAAPQGRSELERLIDVDADPVEFDGVLFAAAYQGRVVAVDLRSGRLMWARDLSVYRGIAVDDNALYVVDADDGLWALSRTNGATLWKQEGLLARSLTAPLLDGKHVIVADVEGYVHWLKREDGSFAGRSRVAKKAITILQEDAVGVLYSVALDGDLTRLLVGK